MCKCNCPKCLACECNPIHLNENDRIKWIDEEGNIFYGTVDKIHYDNGIDGKSYSIVWDDGNFDLYDDWDITPGPQKMEKA